MKSGAFTVQAVTCNNGFRALEAEWNTLLQASASDTIFLTWEWTWTWWEVYGSRAEPYVLTARDETGRLVGLAPLQRVRRRLLPGGSRFDRIEFIGCGHDVTPEYLDFVVAPGRERAVVTAMVDHLRADAGARMIDLRPFRQGSPHLGTVARALAAGGASPAHQSDAICPVMELPTSRQAFLAGRSANYRKKLREYEARCARDLSAKLRVSETPERLNQDMAALIDLHARRWAHRSRAFRTHEYRRFHSELAQRLLARGWMRMFTLEGRSGPLAMLYCFSYGGRYYYYQGGWDPAFARYRVGLVLMHQVIQHAIHEGAEVFDFLRGKETYKYRWANRTDGSVRVTWLRGIGARTVAQVDNVVQRIKDRGRRDGVIGELRRAWRASLQYL